MLCCRVMRCSAMRCAGGRSCCRCVQELFAETRELIDSGKTGGIGPIFALAYPLTDGQMCAVTKARARVLFPSHPIPSHPIPSCGLLPPTRLSGFGCACCWWWLTSMSAVGVVQEAVNNIIKHRPEFVPWSAPAHTSRMSAIECSNDPHIQS